MKSNSKSPSISKRNIQRFMTPPPLVPQGSNEALLGHNSQDLPRETIHATVFRPEMNEDVPLYTTPDLFPVHHSQRPVGLRAGTQVKYRYAIHSAGQFSRWIDDDPRILIVRNDGGANQHVKNEFLSIPTGDLPTSNRPLPSPSPPSIKSPLNVNNNPPQVVLTPSEGVLVVCFYLPIKLTRLRRGVWNVTMDENSLLFRQPSPFSGSVVDRMRARFVGAPPFTEKIAVDERTHVTRALEKIGCVPVFLEENIEKQALEYCEGTLRNVFYGFVDVYGRVPTKWWNPNAQMGSWFAYLQAGKAFATVVQGLYDERTMVWVHGYELIPALPQLARKLHATGTRVGFSLHRPFPSSEIFRTLSVRVELLRAILSANLITFHLYEYVRHFTTCCRRILGLDDESVGAGDIYLDVDGRRVYILALHGGLDPDHIMRSLRSSAVCSGARQWLESTAKGRVLIAGLDFGGPLDGIRTKLAAFERLLSVKPEWADKICLVQRVIDGTWGGAGGGGLAVKLPPPEEKGLPPLEETQDISAQDSSPWNQLACQAICDRLNLNRPLPVVYLQVLKEVPPLSERLALFAAADVLLQTPLREGVSLFPFEFCLASAQTHGFSAHAEDEEASQNVQLPTITIMQPNDDADSSLTTESLQEPPVPDEQSLEALPQQPIPVLVLSEFSSHVTALSGALRVNPWRVDEIVDALIMALEMGREERDARFEADLDSVRYRTATRWAEHILTKIKQVSQREDRTPDVVVGMGLNIRLIRASKVAANLDSDRVVKAFNSSEKRLLLLDYGGTTVVDDLAVMDASQRQFAYRPKGGVLYPNPEVLQSLEALGMENTVYIMSGRTKDELERAFETSPQVGLVAEHGFYTRKPGQLVWERLNDHFDLRDWMETTVNLMELYGKRTHGTYVERKESMVLWQYRDADPEFGAKQAHELHYHLQYVLQDFAVDIVNGKGYVEVRPAGCDKGRAAKALFEEDEYDFVLVFGDDQADEPMFDFFKTVGENPLGDVHRRWNVSSSATKKEGLGNVKMRAPVIFTCIVGVQNTSSARYHVNEVSEVQDMLQSLERASSRRNIGSVLDLAEIDASFLGLQSKALMRAAASMPAFMSDETERIEESERTSSRELVNRRAFSEGADFEEPLEF